MQELINTFSATSQLLIVLLTRIAGISLLIAGIGAKASRLNPIEALRYEWIK